MADSITDQKKQLRDAFGRFASGITVVTLKDGVGRPTGITVNSFSSLSLSPPLLLFSVGKDPVSRRWFEACEHFVVNVLCNAQEDVAWQFARPLPDKFAGVDWREGAAGLPVLEGCIASFECRKWQKYEGGDHMIVIGEVMDIDMSDGEALLFFKGKMARMAG